MKYLLIWVIALLLISCGGDGVETTATPKEVKDLKTEIATLQKEMKALKARESEVLAQEESVQLRQAELAHLNTFIASVDKMGLSVEEVNSTLEAVFNNVPFFRTVLFEIDKSDLSYNARQNLKSMCSALRNYLPRGLEVVGTADDTGTKDYNQDLSLVRAKVVYDYLIGSTDCGLKPEALSYRGTGFQSPSFEALEQAELGNEQMLREERVHHRSVHFNFVYQ